jgi:hypothetical protein
LRATAGRTSVRRAAAATIARRASRAAASALLRLTSAAAAKSRGRQQLMSQIPPSICSSRIAAARCAGAFQSAVCRETLAAGGVADDGRSGGRRHAERLSARCRPLRSNRSADASARRGRTPPHRLRAARRIRLIRPSRASLLLWSRRLTPSDPNTGASPSSSSAVHETSGSIARRGLQRMPSMELIMKRSRRVVLMMMGAAAVTSALPAAALAIPCEPDPRLFRNSNPNRLRDDCVPSRGLPGNRFGHRLRAGG